MPIISHYTSLQVLLNHILEEYQFRLNTLSSVNDPYEYTKRSLSAGAQGDYDQRYANAITIAERILPDKIKVGCFVSDDGDEHKYKTWTSIVNAPLWAHYGDNNQGVALVFDLTRLLASCRRKIDHPWALHGEKVNYVPSLEFLPDPYSVELDALQAVNHLSVTKQLFEKGLTVWFKKNEQWAYENEYRVMLFNEERGNTFVSIKKSLKAIVFGEKVSHVVLNTVGEYCHRQGLMVLSLNYDDVDNCY